MLTVISTVVSLLLYVSCKCFTFPDALKDLSLRNSSWMVGDGRSVELSIQGGKAKNKWANSQSGISF